MTYHFVIGFFNVKIKSHIQFVYDFFVTNK